MDSLNLQCGQLDSPDYKNFILSILIVFGILLSYLPQHIRIISLKSSFGISPYFVLLGTTSGSSALANVVSQQQSLHDMSCCKHISGLGCFSAMLGILQVGTQCLCFFLILFLFVLFFPRNHHHNHRPNTPTYRTALIVAGICILHALVMLITTLTVGLHRPEALQSWSNFCGVLAALLASIQYFPQIYTTVRLRCVGSLSIPMMCIQTPGSLVWAGSLAARLGRDGWSTWGVLIVTACLQGTLLALGVWFEYLGPEKGHGHDEDSDVKNTSTATGAPSGRGGEAAAATEEEEGHERDHPSEETPLLGG
ncbi:PQ-loop repeat-containing protein [Aspergillus homomorphus CBS 101889]|uniref:PQ loop repeat protein n=1 Tax=Aspergillus homomorphus (strain CBS 101889) TaxID=1450537 RepID=A0A395I6W7_ASPHC|nr:PQ loop repeat protein [Aspergillus homomorphus CBS 101889]RAL15529.1 PQ loop repeat protein [Aspergillus homomorphus CBS 101889]